MEQIFNVILHSILAIWDGMLNGNFSFLIAVQGFVLIFYAARNYRRK